MDRAEQKKQYIRLAKDNNSVLILVLILAAAFLLVDGFSNGFYNVINYVAMYGPVCLGLGLVMITGNIDLSIGSVLGMSCMTSATLMCNGWHPLAACIVTMVLETRNPEHVRQIETALRQAGFPLNEDV